MLDLHAHQWTIPREWKDPDGRLLRANRAFAQTFGYFRRSDGVSFDRARQVTEAKARALGLAGAGTGHLVH